VQGVCCEEAGWSGVGLGAEVEGGMTNTGERLDREGRLDYAGRERVWCGSCALVSFLVQGLPLILWGCQPCRAARIGDEGHRRSLLENAAADREIVREDAGGDVAKQR
jgi:hypothetical protein